ncbi:conserved hypothetical protein [Ricinus communis]|uniref:Uncharacterized protein n=1 Tax=Ricinus communis TaxID=3988 RepID=B9RHN2_RICCO|nr:conserved hypothetical protein [Ricinus communis]
MLEKGVTLMTSKGVVSGASGTTPMPCRWTTSMSRWLKVEAPAALNDRRKTMLPEVQGGCSGLLLVEEEEGDEREINGDEGKDKKLKFLGIS